MAPNIKFPLSNFDELQDEDMMNVIADQHHKQFTNDQVQDDINEFTKLLDSKADTNGLSTLSDESEDWTDVKHSERKKRDRILDDGVLLKLMKKSDYEGFKRLFINLSIMAATANAIYRLNVFPVHENSFSLGKLVVFVPLYLFYGFQFQCFAFAGQHEFLHRNAFKTKWINDYVLFLTGCVTFEFGKHERLMHKQHHTFTNNIDKDPELTSNYSREELENPNFRNVARDRWNYFLQFLDIASTFKRRLCRVIYSARGVPVDYTGTGWSMKTWTYSTESGLMSDLQKAAWAQLLIWVAVFGMFGRTYQGLQGLFFWWIVPVVLGYPSINYLRNLEHADCELTPEINNSFINTRTVASNPLVRLLTWDTNYHAEHHCYPMVPFFNLHKVHKLMKDHVIHSECDHFTTQNWKCIKPGGWIDQQAKLKAQ